MGQRWACLDGNEAAARVAYALSEVISIYPITPASGMAEHADDWAAAGRPNAWGKVPDVVEMQSEDPRRTAAGMEAGDLELITEVRAAIAIPLAVKLSPYYSTIANFAARAREHGADGLVLFNRFYQPDLDLETLGVVHRVELSRPSELRLPLCWIAILRPQLGAEVSLAATSGIHTGLDAVKALMVGADVAMMTSALLVNGPEHLRKVEREL